MPTISLRLTDEEHTALKDWAHGSHRSMQREAVFRIFAEPEYVPQVVEVPQEFFDQIMEKPGEVLPGGPVKRRMHPCKHHLPPSKHCPYGCDGCDG